MVAMKHIGSGQMEISYTKNYTYTEPFQCCFHFQHIVDDHSNLHHSLQALKTPGGLIDDQQESLHFIFQCQW